MSVPTRSNKAVTLVKVEIGCDGNGDPWPDDGWGEGPEGASVRALVNMLIRSSGISGEECYQIEH